MSESAAKAKASDYRPRTVQSVSHAVTLLKLISSLKAPSLSDLSRKVGLSKPATYNLLNTLIEEGLVKKDAAAKYTLGWGMYELGSVVDLSQRLKGASRFALDRLANATGGAALLSVVDKDSVLYLDRGQDDPTFSMIANVGRRSPLHTNASGKVLLAGLELVAAERYLARPLAARTTTTITDPMVLRREIATVREEGFGACWGEQEPTLSSVAVPIADPAGATRGSLAVAIPTARFRTMSRSSLVSRMKAEAVSISERMDWSA